MKYNSKYYYIFLSAAGTHVVICLQFEKNSTLFYK